MPAAVLGLALGAGAPISAQAQIRLAATSEPGAPLGKGLSPPNGACLRLIPETWPDDSAGRAARLRLMEGERGRCIGNPDFLAALGALYLEEGDVDRALIWLERSLLLDPGNLGAQADHALALAAQGEGKALDQLRRAWLGRSDVPPALRQRLYPDEANGVLARPRAIRLGGIDQSRWGVQREVSLLAGYESNLDQSPRLDELTLTAPEGDVKLPVTSRPRRGAAILGTMSAQAAFSPQQGDVWRAGITAAGRSSPDERRTDWSYLQLGASAVHRWAWWRTFAEVSATRVGGPLNEPYLLYRVALSAEASIRSCRLRLGFDGEQRRQSETVAFNAKVGALQILGQCPLEALPDAVWSVLVRTSSDRPDSDSRPGGPQRQQMLGLRLASAIGARWQADLSARFTASRDSEGYSVLLENNAVRKMRHQQLSLELNYRPEDPFWAGAQPTAQVQWVRQRSNLRLFEYDTVSVYGGLRWAW